MANFNYITNTNQLNKEFNIILEKVIKNVSDILLKDFLNHLDATIYAAPKGDYVRNRENGGFYSGWEIKENQSSAIHGYIRSLVFNGSNLVAPSYNNGLAHGGATGGDQRGKMAWILNDIIANYDYSYNGGAKYLSDAVGNYGGYWDTYLAGLDDKIVKWLDEEFNRYGIVRR